MMVEVRLVQFPPRASQVSSTIGPLEVQKQDLCAVMIPGWHGKPRSAHGPS
jgi:hypothetical protein